MHISIEGMDGSGKTSTAKRVAEILGYKFIEKPLHLITDKDNKFDTYMDVVSRVNQMDPSFKARFYGLGNYLVSRSSKTEDIVTDRHLASNYYWNGIEDDEYFDYLVNECGNPDITIILYVSAAERKRRIAIRSPNDPDLERNVFDDSCYERMYRFMKHNKMNYFIIDANNKGFKQVTDEVMSIIRNNMNTLGT